MAVSTFNREKITGFFVKVVVEDERSYLERRQEQRGYFERRLSLTEGVVAEYQRVETIRMYEDAAKDLANFDQTLLVRLRWMSVLGLKIPISPQKPEKFLAN